MTTYNPCRSLVREHELWIEHIKDDWYHEARERGVSFEQYNIILAKKLEYPTECLKEAKRSRDNAYRKSQLTISFKMELVGLAFHPNRIYGWDDATFDMMVGD
jgi:hypothetical protein